MSQIIISLIFSNIKIDKLVTEESLRELFSKYGLVVDASIKKSMIDTVRLYVYLFPTVKDVVPDCK